MGSAGGWLPGLALLLLAGGVAGQEGAAPIRVRWRDGLRLETPRGAIGLRWSLRLHWDAAWASRDADREARTGPVGAVAGARRAHLLLRGRLGEDLRWRSETDFRAGAPKFLSQYGEASLGGGMRLRGGHFREPMGLEARSTGSELLFLERSPAAELTPGRNAGLAILGEVAAERGDWAVGLFRDSDRVGRGVGPGGWAVSVRLGARPWSTADGAGWLHLGASATFRDTPDGYAVGGRPETLLLPEFVATGALPAAAVRGVGVELAGTRRGWTLLSEWLRWEAGVPGAGDPDLEAATVQLGWLPGGGSRSYDAGRGALRAVREPGTLEFSLRWSRLDLREAARGQLLDTWTAGVSLHLRREFRVLANLARARIPGLPEAWVPMLRLALDL